MTCSACQQTIENHLNSLEGVKSATVSLLTHKASVQYRPKTIGVRTIIEEIECLGFDARYEAKTDKTDIRDILELAVNKQRAKY
jgi:P-type Cu+ transporter